MFKGFYELRPNTQQFRKLKDYDPAQWPYIIIRWFNVGISKRNPDVQAAFFGVYRSRREAEKMLIQLNYDSIG